MGVHLNTCLHLNHELAKSGRGESVGVWCKDCERWATKDLTGHPGWALPKTHPMLVGVNRVTLPRRYAVAIECEICDEITHTPQEHHWCVQALYRDAGTKMKREGPMGWLCAECHGVWHQLVTPMLGGTMTFDRATELLRTWFKKWKRHEWDAFVNAVVSADAQVKRRKPEAPSDSGQAA